MSPVRQPEETRAKILGTALELFHACSFKGTSINHIVEKAGITKGALFHHFKGKNELGYAVVDELCKNVVRETWVVPLASSTDPIADILAILVNFREEVDENPEVLECGCPVNNLSQEMSSVDETFRQKLKEIFLDWQDAIEKALKAGIDSGNVRQDIDCQAMAATLVALFEGSIGTLKVYRTPEQMDLISAGCRFFLSLLRP